MVADDPDAGVPGAYQPNENGNFVFEAESVIDQDQPGGFSFHTTDDLPDGHEAPSGGGYVEATGNSFSQPGGETLTYQFTPDQDGFVRVNLVASHQGNTTEENDSWTGVHLNGAPLQALEQDVPLEPKGGDGLYKTYSSGGSGDSFILVNKNVDNNPQPIVFAVEAGETYDFLLSERSAEHEVDRIILEFLETEPGPNSFGDQGLKNEPLSGQIAVVPVGEAVLTVNEGQNGIEASNFGAGSFQITNTGSKNISSIEIDVTDALFPDAVFDPFGLAGDLTGKILEINSEGGTGVITPVGGFGQDAIGVTYLGDGGIDGFETIRLEFDDFNSGETLTFAVDMDPNSIAGAEKGTLDSGAVITDKPGDDTWDVGGIGGAELINSLFSVTYYDDTTSEGRLQGQGAGQQIGAKALSTQASEDLAVALTVNGLSEGAAGSYGADGPTVTVQGPDGEVARVVLAKGFIVPFENNFPDDPDDPNEYHDQLDAQLGALAASAFPANNVAEFQYVDVQLDGTAQDITSLFDFTDVDAFTIPAEFYDESQLPLGFAASVVDPSTDLSKGPVTAPIHLVYSENAAPDITDPGAQTIDEGGAFSLQIAATDPEGDTPHAYALQLLDAEGAPVADPAFTINPATGLITGEAPAVLEETVLTARVTVTDAAGSAATIDIHVTVADAVADADLSLTKTVSDATPAFGDSVTFEITVDNSGDDPAGGVVVKDLLPSGFAFEGATASAGSYDDATGLWTVGPLGAGGDATLTITATVLEDGAPTADTVLHRINVGGSAVAVADGSSQGWSADTSGSSDPNRVAGSNNTYNGNAGSAHSGSIGEFQREVQHR